MPRPVCVKCKREMYLEQLGVVLVEYDGSGDYYRMTNGDIYTCPTCKIQIVTGYAQRSHYIHDGREAFLLALSKVSASKLVEAHPSYSEKFR